MGSLTSGVRTPLPALRLTEPPYITSLSNSYVVGSSIYGINHFSEANYRALSSGDTFGCSNSGCAPVSNPSLVDRLEATMSIFDLASARFS